MSADKGSSNGGGAGKSGSSSGGKTSAAPARDTSSAAPSTAPGMAMEPTIAQRLGNRGLQALLQGSAASSGEPNDASTHRAWMGSRFGLSFANVQLRDDAQSHATAQAAGANAYARPGEVGFARGRYAPHTPDGRRTLAHEFAHVAQFSGGHPGMPALPTRDLAEWQADDAAATVMAGGRPRLSAFSGTHAPLYDDPKRAKPQASTLTTSDDMEALKAVLKMLDTLPDGGQRSEAFKFLVPLAMKAGPANAEATKRLVSALTGMPTKRLADHVSAVYELQEWTADVRAYEFLLMGRMWWADRSSDDLNEIGSTMVVGSFRTWLHYSKGRWCIDFLRRKITGTDKTKAHLAARIVEDLLDGSSDPKEKKYAANYAALRDMARDNGWDSYGALGGASATPRIFSALEGIRKLADELAFRIEIGPIFDHYKDDDAKRLRNLVAGLSVKGPLSTTEPDGTVVRLFTAENDEETERSLIDEDPMSSGRWLLEMARTYTLALDLGIKVQERTRLLHENADALDKFLGDKSTESDERKALFDLRHEYIEAWLSFTSNRFSAGSEGVAALYEAQMRMVDGKFDRFDEVVAERKFKTARKQFLDYKQFYLDGKDKYPGNDQLKEQFFFDMRNVLDDEYESLTESFQTSGKGQWAGRVVNYDIPHTDLNEVARQHMSTALFGMQSALFLMYATNLSVHNMMLKADIGSSSFQKTQGQRLTDMRTEMQGFWARNAFDEFLKKTSDYEETLKNVIEKIKDRAKLDLLLNLAITLVAALITQGAALVVRMAALSRTLALVRTARAVSSVWTLTEIGVMTGVELSLRSAVFGKDITLNAAIKTAGTNLLFLGALKAVGTLSSSLIKGSPFRQLMMGHLVGFSGTATVSATLTRIETGHWPPDMAEFLMHTGATYLLLAGAHAGFQKMVTTPVLTKLGNTRLESLKIDNEALATKYQQQVDSGTMAKGDFEAIRSERVRLLEESKAIAKVLKEGGVMKADEFAGIEKMADDAIALARNAKFPEPDASGTTPTIKALPSPDSVIDLVRVGDTDTYVYDPSKPSHEIDALLKAHEDHGYRIEGNAGLRRVVSWGGRTKFLLSSAPMPNTQLLLPERSGGPAGMDTTKAGPLERATALSGPALETARAQLKRVSPQAEAKLPGEYADHTVLAALRMLLDNATLIKEPWSIDATRGLADALMLERGITRSALRRLFLSVDPAKLPELMARYHEIANSANVKPGNQFLIADDLLPKNSVKLIDAYRQLKAAGVELPPDMDMRATRGLLKQMDAMPGGWLQWIKGLAKEKRGLKLRALSGLNDPTVRLPENMVQLVNNITADMPGHAGLNPLAGANGEAFVAQVEAAAGGGKFADANLRNAFVSKVDTLRMDVAQLQQGRPLQHGEWENVVGRANEVRQLTAILLRGATVQVADSDVGPKAPLPNVNLANYALPGGGKVVNAPTDMNVHMDLVFTEKSGTLVAMEMTTAELGLPTPLNALDPQSPSHGSNIDWGLLDKGNAHHRKFMQAIKIYQLNKMATEFSTAWSGQAVSPAEMRIQAGDFSAPAARALEGLGFKLVRFDGTVETAAQVEARKGPGKKAKP